MLHVLTHLAHPRPTLSRGVAVRVCLVLSLVLSLPAKASAAAPPVAAASSAERGLFAAGIWDYVPTTVTRTNVVRICVGVMALALWIIIMKKFDGGDPTNPSRTHPR